MSRSHFLSGRGRLGAALLLLVGIALGLLRAKVPLSVDAGLSPRTIAFKPPVESSTGPHDTPGDIVIQGPAGFALFKLQFLRRRLEEARKKGDAHDIAELEKRIAPMEQRLALARQREAGDGVQGPVSGEPEPSP